ncbi:prepilin-type N-terminal cleavage/methylation domain-containing protein [Photobacterium sp. GB-56]|uniref:prepilin-type N-terminal cleavage/methylation domain-containing protein n=1 Tax=Photobacterium sp. GB-56 TaxID=2022106 RepID=UPI000D186F34|nr:prepilin-type N-terminal cleavage/methylation domain-containing protein [Photobacterium sp. GB-56]PSV26201.1 prepilin-type cleavage/methylation domain-containing protein [Photobacterium sp. GB-56]
MKKSKGFTLIEIVVVIVILGILAVVAVPKFLNIQRDARIATLKATKGALESSFAIFAAKTELPSANIYTDKYGYRFMLSGSSTTPSNENKGIRISNYDNYPWFSSISSKTEYSGIEAIKKLANIDVYPLDNKGNATHKLNIEFYTNTDGDFRIFPQVNDYYSHPEQKKCYLQYNVDNLAKPHFTLFTSDC